jgi:hypothetical protein
MLLAAASVHNSTNDNWIKRTAICVPFPKGSVVRVLINIDSGYLGWSTWQLLSTSQNWAFKKAESLAPNTYIPAHHDGFVNGVLTAPNGGPRGHLRLDCVRDKEQSSLHSYPIASAAVHQWEAGDVWIKYASAMIPVRRDFWIWSEAVSTSGTVQANVHWTAVVPAY